ncbi:YciI family protein [Paenibacillus sp. RC67]|uniref:YciI family protein n=1 Tax=Paenibacillus sp. RC67 TaxID=3039392 RepID=UPI0024AE6E02|nr:YciI family protein [Paenibacillus sp. RC67]
MRYLIIYKRGTDWSEDIPLNNQPFIPEHAVYLQLLFDEGKILMAGPFKDHTGGGVVIEVETEGEAVLIAQNDPAVLHHTFDYELKHWSDILNKYENKSKNFNQDYLDYKHKVQKDLNII